MMQGIRTTMNLSQSWGVRVRDEAAANNLSMSAYIWRVFLLGYEVLHDDEMEGKL